MKTLIYGAGPLGTLYAHRLIQAGKDVTILARGQRYDWIQANGLALVVETPGPRRNPAPTSWMKSGPKMDRTDKEEQTTACFRDPGANARIKNILFMGNKARGLKSYIDALPEILNVKAIPGLLGSKFAEITFARHARAARDEMEELADMFQSRVEQTSMATPNIKLLRAYVD